MLPQKNLSTEWDILSEVVRISSSLREELAAKTEVGYPAQSPIKELDPPLPPMELPLPLEALEELSSLRVPHSIRKTILQCVHAQIVQIQQEYINAFKRTCLQTKHTHSTFVPDFHDIQQVYQASYKRHCVPMVKGLVSSISAKVASYRQPLPSEEKRIFNSEYTPMLEKYFEYNAYPSAQHQSFLAQKSMMTRRQIEVWFQNHRNRAKKDERTLRRNTTDFPLRMALAALQYTSPSPATESPFSSEEETASETSEVDRGDHRPTSCIDAFDDFRPDHAFPSVYPSSCPDPFASDPGNPRFPPPVWTRRPAKIASTSLTASVDIDDLSRMFHAKLNICEGVKKGRIPRMRQACAPWYTSTVTIPPQAPLPAFLPILPCHQSSSKLSSFLMTGFRFPAGARLHSVANAFNIPCPEEVKRTRKSSQLPRRSPMATPATITSRRRPASRISSSSSDYTSHSRSSSSSSRSRTPEPTTPPQSPTLNSSSVPQDVVVHRELDNLNFNTFYDNDTFGTAVEFPGVSGAMQGVTLGAAKQPPLPTLDFDALFTFTSPHDRQIWSRS
ncbi:hypothetical protein CVT26_011253 [Gymnopilus dilepis]|uniref:Homeobox domain-containing protein n=1 Tax=Gymnopilus dilepis TaxID=231916 RepID=A0A409VYY1_9AGAR|nr:hypothetical protein CVT26_011253 [Gymnopilus dilepis]